MYPTADEVAVVIPGDGSEFNSNREILVRYNSNENDQSPFKRISLLHGAYDPLTYVLLFPYGTYGWTPFVTCLANDRT